MENKEKQPLVQVKHFDDLELLKNYGNDKIDVTIGSALD